MELDYLISIGEAMTDVLTDMKARDEIPMTRQQAAIYLGVSVATISNYVNQGKLTKKTKYGLIGYMPADLRQLKK